MNVWECQPTPPGRFKVSFWEESGFLLERLGGSQPRVLFLSVLRSRRRCRSAAFQRNRRHAEVGGPVTPRPRRKGWERAGWRTPHPSPSHMKVRPASPGGRLTTGSRYSFTPRHISLSPLPRPNFWDGFYWKCTIRATSTPRAAQQRPVGGSPTILCEALDNFLHLLNSQIPQHTLNSSPPFAAICTKPSKQFHSILSYFEDQNGTPLPPTPVICVTHLRRGHNQKQRCGWNL